MQKDFKYEANIDLKALRTEVDIQDIQCLMSIIVRTTDNKQVLANVDLINQKVYLVDQTDLRYNNDNFKSKVLEHIRQKSFVAEDLYEAKQEDYDDFDNARKQQEIIENSLQEEQE